MTASVWTIRNPLAGNQQPVLTSDTPQHPLGTRVNAWNNLMNVERRMMYVQAGATLAAAAAASADAITNIMVAGLGATAKGSSVAAINSGQYGWLLLTEVS